MVRNQKGFSIIELLAVIAITSVIIIPLMTTFVNFFEINDRMHARRNAVGIADITTNSMNRFNFTEIKPELDISTDRYFLLTSDQCTTLFLDPNTQNFCTQIFTLQYNNMTIPSENMKIYFIEYNISTTDKQNLLQVAAFEPEVKDKINDIFVSAGVDVASIMRYIVYIEYSSDPRGVIILDGVMIND